MPNKQCFWIVVLEKPLESLLDCEEIKSINPKGNQPWIFIGSADAEAAILWPPDVKTWLIGKDFDAGKDWGQEEKGATVDEMAAWHQWLNRHESEQTQREWRQGILACFSPLSSKEWVMIQQLNNNVDIDLVTVIRISYLISNVTLKSHSF